MSSKLTQNLRLHIWEPGDDFLREEFNANFEAVDRHMPRMAAGAYVGDGAASRDIDLGFTPRAVLVLHSTGAAGSRMGLAILGYPCRDSSTAAHEIYMEVVEGGFRLTNAGSCNLKGHEYHYLALR